VFNEVTRRKRHHSAPIQRLQHHARILSILPRRARILDGSERRALTPFYGNRDYLRGRSSTFKLLIALISSTRMSRLALGRHTNLPVNRAVIRRPGTKPFPGSQITSSSSLVSLLVPHGASPTPLHDGSTMTLCSSPSVRNSPGTRMHLSAKTSGTVRISQIVVEIRGSDTPQGLLLATP
jgi:hypothetical protein